jgi:hypothetical protein
MEEKAAFVASKEEVLAVLTGILRRQEKNVRTRDVIWVAELLGKYYRSNKNAAQIELHPKS